MARGLVGRTDYDEPTCRGWSIGWHRVNIEFSRWALTVQLGRVVWTLGWLPARWRESREEWEHRTR